MQRELQGVHLVGIALGVSLLVAVGVHWLRQLPASTEITSRPGVLRVALVPLPAAVNHQASHPPAPGAARPIKAEHLPVQVPVPPSPTVPHLVAVTTIRPMEPPVGPVETRADRVTASAAADGIASEFQRILLAHIGEYRAYPAAARAQHMRGTAQVVFTMDREGRVLGVWIAASSGHAVLDQAAIEMIRRAQPLPPIPAVLPATLNVRLPVAFGPGGP